jgi:hypothetical protein
MPLLSVVCNNFTNSILLYNFKQIQYDEHCTVEIFIALISTPSKILVFFCILIYSTLLKLFPCIWVVDLYLLSSAAHIRVPSFC